MFVFISNDKEYQLVNKKIRNLLTKLNEFVSIPDSGNGSIKV